MLFPTHVTKALALFQSVTQYSHRNHRTQSQFNPPLRNSSYLHNSLKKWKKLLQCQEPNTSETLTNEKTELCSNR